MGESCRNLNSFLPRCLLLLTIAVAGCRSGDLVEAELRSRERELRRLRSEVQRLDGENQALAHELGGIRHEGGVHIPPELAAQTYTVKKITLGRLTGGYSNENAAADEALRVIVEPRDSDNHTIKAPGSVHVEAMEISSEGLKTPLSSWDVGPIPLRRSWQSGLFTNGYALILPWKNWPAREKLRIVVQLRLSDGRLFETDRDITVRIAGQGLQKKRPTSVPMEGPTFPVPPSEEPLPLPRKVSSAGWQRNFDSPQGVKESQSWVRPVAAWTPSELPDLSSAVRLMKPVAQTSDEWPPR